MLAHDDVQFSKLLGYLSDMDRQIGLEQKLREQFDPDKTPPSVHAEIQMLHHFYETTGISSTATDTSQRASQRVSAANCISDIIQQAVSNRSRTRRCTQTGVQHACPRAAKTQAGKSTES